MVRVTCAVLSPVSLSICVSVCVWLIVRRALLPGRPPQSTSDVSRSASSSETTERGRKATPLLLADLDKELQKLHSGKNQLVSEPAPSPGCGDKLLLPITGYVLLQFPGYVRPILLLLLLLLLF